MMELGQDSAGESISSDAGGDVAVDNKLQKTKQGNKHKTDKKEKKEKKQKKDKKEKKEKKPITQEKAEAALTLFDRLMAELFDLDSVDTDALRKAACQWNKNLRDIKEIGMSHVCLTLTTAIEKRALPQNKIDELLNAKNALQRAVRTHASIDPLLQVLGIEHPEDFSTGPASPDAIRQLFDPSNNFKASIELEKEVHLRPGSDSLAAYCILGDRSERHDIASDVLLNLRARSVACKTQGGTIANAEADNTLDRSMGCFLGNVVGDALGGPLEFAPVRYTSSELTGMCQDEIWQREGYNAHRLKPGQWTDDASMALCIADSLLCCAGLDAIDLRQRFHMWNSYGYNNSFGRDPDQKSRSSVGLGNNISMSIKEWKHPENQTWESRQPKTSEGTKSTSGNGSVMRNSPLSVWFRDDLGSGMTAAYQQSKTTHGGDEAAELCRLLTFICIRFINGASRDLLEDLSAFETPLDSVRHLAAAECEGDDSDRCWNWRSACHRYSASRVEQDPGYIGSYAMDCVSMALHCVHSTSSFEQATLKAANLRGDSDTVCAVVGQIAGALYGASAIPHSWWACVERWDDGSIAARALMLYNKERVSLLMALSSSACDSAQRLGHPIDKV